MKYNCQRCEKAYEAKRLSSKFCSSKCRVAAHKKEKADRLAAGALTSIAQPYQPTADESVLTLIFWRYQAAVDKLALLARQLPVCAEATELLVLLTRLGAISTPEVVWRVTGHDLSERLERPEAFKTRTKLEDINIPTFI